jgi:hypothetical protein
MDLRIDHDFLNILRGEYGKPPLWPRNKSNRVKGIHIHSWTVRNDIISDFSTVIWRDAGQIWS